MMRVRKNAKAWYWVRAGKRSPWVLRQCLVTPPKSHARPFRRKCAGPIAVAVSRLTARARR